MIYLLQINLQKLNLKKICFSHRLSGMAGPEVAGHSPADHQEPAVAILEIYPVRNAVEQRAQQVPLMSQRDLGMPLPGAIPKNPLYADTPPRLVADRCLDDVHPRFLPLGRGVFLVTVLFSRA